MIRRAAGWVCRVVSGAIAAVLIMMVRAYQVTLSPIIGRQCRFQPTCSQYFIEAVRMRGPFIGTALGIRRLLRCNPCFRGGYDPVPPGKASSRAREKGPCKRD